MSKILKIKGAKILRVKGNTINMYGGTTGVENEVPIGVVNGSNALFTTAFPFVAGSLQLSINGVRQKAQVDYFEIFATHEIQIADSPTTGDILIIDYQKQL
jgi:hypothetical protein